MEHGKKLYNKTLTISSFPEVGIYKRKQELDQENDQEKKESFFLGRFLGRERVFSLYFLFS